SRTARPPPARSVSRPRPDPIGLDDVTTSSCSWHRSSMSEKVDRDGAAVGRRFAGAVAVVTGAGHGIGAACARRLAQEGARVMVLDLDGDAAAAVARSLPRADDVEHHAIAVDVTDASAVTEALAAVEQRTERLDALVNVAGGGMPEPAFEDGDDEPFERMWQLNFLSVVRVTRAAIPMLQRSDRAAVVTARKSGVEGKTADAVDPTR